MTYPRQVRKRRPKWQLWLQELFYESLRHSECQVRVSEVSTDEWTHFFLVSTTGVMINLYFRGDFYKFFKQAGKESMHTPSWSAPKDPVQWGESEGAFIDESNDARIVNALKWWQALHLIIRLRLPF